MSKKRGEIFVYAGYGLVVPDGEDVKEVNGRKIRFLRFIKVKENTVICIPEANLETCKIRKPLSKKEAEEIWQLMQRRKRAVKIDGKKWIKRYKELTERVKNASARELAEIFSELVACNRIKPLSYGEKSILENIKNILCEELAFVLNKSEEELHAQLDKLIQH